MDGSFQKQLWWAGKAGGMGEDRGLWSAGRRFEKRGTGGWRGKAGEGKKRRGGGKRWKTRPKHVAFGRKESSTGLSRPTRGL